ncbi:hypothetical protein [Absidia glauca]|uniref:Pentacotripeptide-repeat region of PRORP domain-containing protein n=1 Tax=Absidia glauca TaxID=4829 RepID=A0A168STD0_ABSGL|nr:hypothetical protein [Absidia glauca]
MTFTRLILKSLRSRAARSLHGTFLHQQYSHELVSHHRAILAPKVSPFIRSYTTATSSPTSTSSTADLLDTEAAPATLDPSNDDDQPQLSESNIKFEGRTSDEVWEDYMQQVNDPSVTLTADDYFTVCVVLKRDRQSPDSIKRIQTLLKHLHDLGTMPDLFVRCCNMLIYLYLEQGSLDSARLVFSGLIRSEYEPTTVTIRSMLHGIGKLGTAKDVLALYKSLRQQGLFPESNDTYQQLLWVLGVNFGQVDSSVKIFTKMQQQGLTLDIKTYNMMLSIYKRAKQPERAWAFYTQQILAHATPDRTTFYKLLQTIQQMKKGNEATQADRIQTVYHDMLRLGVPVGTAHYQAMGWDAMDTLDQLKKDGRGLTVHDYNILIASAVKNNKFGDALSMYSDMSGGDSTVTPDAYTYGIIMDALVKDVEQPSAAVFDIYEEMKERQITPDVAVFSSLLQACGHDSMDRALGYLEEMQALKIEPNSYILNSFLGYLIRKPTKSKNDMYCARAMWDQMIAKKVFPDTRSFNNYLSLLVPFVPTINPNELKASRQLQQNDDDDDDDDVFGDPTSTVAMSGTAKYMLKIYRTMRHTPTGQPDFLSYSILINTLVNHGQVRHAMVLFRDAQLAHQKLGLNVYNTMLQGLLRDNDLHQVMLVWQDMKVRRVLPDSLTYDLVLDACEQLHLVNTFTALLEQRNADRDRLRALDDDRERRWERAKSIKEQQQGDE